MSEEELFQKYNAVISFKALKNILAFQAFGASPFITGIAAN